MEVAMKKQATNSGTVGAHGGMPLGIESMTKNSGTAPYKG